MFGFVGFVTGVVEEDGTRNPAATIASGVVSPIKSITGALSSYPFDVMFCLGIKAFAEAFAEPFAKAFAEPFTKAFAEPFVVEIVLIWTA